VIVGPGELIKIPAVAATMALRGTEQHKIIVVSRFAELRRDTGYLHDLVCLIERLSFICNSKGFHQMRHKTARTIDGKSDHGRQLRVKITEKGPNQP